MSNAYGSKDLSETFQDALTACAKVVLGLGLVCLLCSVSLLIFLCFRIAGDPSLAQAAVGNIGLATRVLFVSVFAVAIGAGYLFWDEDVVPGIQLIIAAAMYCSPMFIPGLLNVTANNATIDSALNSVAMAGAVFGGLSALTLAVEIGIRVRSRVKIGVKSDQMKYGKGVKEEADKQNVFFGNCWQLPYCRKFVRERCPIFHSRRTCWREKVGCMCEEEVIRNALENKPIPKDALLAAKMIPRNHRLSEQQKIDRCKNCVIYNEHQRHKYKAGLWIAVFGAFACYGLLHGPLVSLTAGVVDKVNDVINGVTLRPGEAHVEAPTVFVEGLLFLATIVVLTYALKVLEYCVFKLKI